ncbi:MAG: hypothetical protein ACYTFA_08470 [Planctomycetota bacterium]|jgi:hypothetical protein
MRFHASPSAVVIAAVVLVDLSHAAGALIIFENDVAGWRRAIGGGVTADQTINWDDVGPLADAGYKTILPGRYSSAGATPKFGSPYLSPNPGTILLVANPGPGFFGADFIPVSGENVFSPRFPGGYGPQGIVTITFDRPMHAIGAWFLDVEGDFQTTGFRFSGSGGCGPLDAAFSADQGDDSRSFLGLVSDTAFTSVQIHMSSGYIGDGVGIDDLMFTDQGGLCGDGIVDEGYGEDCDEGGVDAPTCDFDCTFVACGDEHINEAAGEQCDVGGYFPQGLCSQTCQLEGGIPTFSLKLAGVNGSMFRDITCQTDSDCPQGSPCVSTEIGYPTNFEMRCAPIVDIPELMLCPGDDLALEVYLRGWCVEGDCAAGPLLGAYLYTTDSCTFSSQGSAEADALQMSSVACLDDLDCRYGSTRPADCTCFHAVCWSDNTCSIEASVYVDFARLDYAFHSTGQSGAVGAVGPDYLVGFTANFGGVRDDDTERYLGSLWLNAPLGADGTYVVEFLDDRRFTGVTTNGAQPWPVLRLEPLVLPIDAQDTDQDGYPDCADGCPTDPYKTEPGVCGCGVSEDADSDDDNVPDCADQCPGVDDDLFAPGCNEAIPTTSGWGLLAAALLFLTAAKICFDRRRYAV